MPSDTETSTETADRAPRAPVHTPAEAARRRGIDAWGQGWFGVSDDGSLTVHPGRDPAAAVDVHGVVGRLLDRGVGLPVVLRFPQILEDRVRLLCESFDEAIRECGYDGDYRGVYPIKVNQQRHVIEAIVRAGEPWNFGLEVGSKPELIAALALHPGGDALLCCNGFKDAEYMELAMLGARTGRRVMVVMEKYGDVETLLARLRDDDDCPELGVRCRLNSRGSGRWVSSAGAGSKFGLDTGEVLNLTERLRERGLLDRLRMVHFHVGSQITDIRRLKHAMREGARIWASLRSMGVPVEYLNVGGGLGVDYDGSRTAGDSSVNYTVQEYANEVVWTVHEVCTEAGVPTPHLVSESGRFLTAHHSMVAVEVVGRVQGDTPDEAPPVRKDEHRVVTGLRELAADLTGRNHRETYHDAQVLREELHAAFTMGYLDLQDRAAGETLIELIFRGVLEHARGSRAMRDERRDLESLLADRYICNFSVFQSLPDHWAVDQLFPITPVHRLTEKADVQATLVDISCDSDGQVDEFTDLREIRHTLDLHRLRPGERYFLAACLTGAYQDILGDFHNLFGAVNEAHVRRTDDGEVHIRRVVPGQTAGDTLQFTGHHRHELEQLFADRVERAVNGGDLDAAVGESCNRTFRQAFDQYTYLQT